MLINTDKMQLFDISMPIHPGMAVYKGVEAKRPIHTVQSDYSTGSVYESRLDMNLHTGTHLDRQLHMIPGGNTVESLELTKVVTKCKVLDLTKAVDKITAEDLQQKEIKEGDFLLLKTRNSLEDILETDFIYVDRTGANFLKDKRIKGVGIDSLGIERAQADHETHIRLLSEDVVILEGLRLKEIEEGEYFLFAAPLNIIGAEASPLRAVLVR